MSFFNRPTEQSNFCAICHDTKPCVELYDGEYYSYFCAECLLQAVILLQEKAEDEFPTESRRAELSARLIELLKKGHPALDLLFAKC